MTPYIIYSVLIITTKYNAMWCHSVWHHH